MITKMAAANGDQLFMATDWLIRKGGGASGSVNFPELFIALNVHAASACRWLFSRHGD